MLVMTGGAGGGKSTAAREHLKNFADVSPTTKQADEKYDDALNLGRNAMRYRSRNYNRDLADNYTPESVPLGLDAELGCVPCASPDICNNLSQIGGVQCQNSVNRIAQDLRNAPTTATSRSGGSSRITAKFIFPIKTTSFQIRFTQDILSRWAGVKKISYCVSMNPILPAYRPNAGTPRIDSKELLTIIRV